MSAPGGEPDQRRLEAAARAVLSSEELVRGGHGAIVEDAVALLHGHVRAAPSLDALAKLASRRDLRRALSSFADLHPQMLYAGRASRELAVALAVAAPGERVGRARALRWAGGDAPSALVAPAVVVAANLTAAVSLAASALLWLNGSREFPPPFDRWLERGLLGGTAVVDLLSIALATLILGGVGSHLIVRSLERQQRDDLAGAVSPASLRDYSVPIAVAHFGRVFAGLGGLASVVALVGWAARRSLLDALFRQIVVTLFALLPAFLLSMDVFVAASLATALLRSAARALRRDAAPAVAPVEPAGIAAPEWDAAPVAVRPALARKRVDAAVDRWVRARDAARSARLAEERRLGRLADALKRDMGVPPADDAQADPSGTYRAPPAAPADRVEPASDDPTGAARLALLADPATGAAFRADLILSFAERAGAQADDESAAAIVLAARALLHRASMPLSPREYRMMARVASQQRGGFRRLQAIAGEALLTDDDPSPRVRVEAEPEPGDEAERTGSTGSRRGRR
jgi:hypothetical protein